MELLDHIAAQIRELRAHWNDGEGLSQEALARELNVAPNTISRWETGVYLPSVPDLEKLARFFAVPITSFFPPETAEGDNESWAALLRTARQLHPDDLEELRKYAEFRKSRRLFDQRNQRKARSRRKGTKHK
jgi:transcriptional regulator with XRE-family HTH domain